jgi:hypothetical protein
MNNTDENIVGTLGSLLENIAEQSVNVQTMKTAYINAMQVDAGYELTTTDENFIKKFNAGEIMPRGLVNAEALGLVKKIEIEPPRSLIDAVNALESDIKNFREISGAFLIQHTVSLKSTRKTGTRSTGTPGAGKLQEVLSIDPNARITLVDVGMSHPHIQGVLSNGKSIDIDCYAATLTEHVYKALGRA